MPGSDAVRVILKFWPAMRRGALGLVLGLIALLLFIRAARNPDRLGQDIDDGVGAVAAVGALAMGLRATWSVLVVRQQDRAPNALRNHPSMPSSGLEQPHDAIRRMSGKNEEAD